MSDVSGGPGWWQASDDKWYRPEQHPDYRPPAPPPEPQTQALPQYFPPPALPESKGNKTKWFIGGGTIVVAVVLVIVLALVFGKSTPTGVHTSADRSTSTTAGSSGTALVALATQYVSAWNTETSANQAWVAASAPIVADETKQNERIQEDVDTVDANEDGLGCDAADFTNYSSCVQQEDQKAASAQSDEAAAGAQFTTDVTQYTSDVGAYEDALSNFISQVATLNWPSSMASAVGNLLTTARTYRSDLAQEAAETATTPQATISAIQAQVGTDNGNFTDANSLIKADLLHLGQSVPQ
jgi:hypothetical protein